MDIALIVIMTMERRNKIKTKLLLLLIIFLSCKDVDLVTKENYNQIEMNMPQNQVIAIM